MFQHDLLRFLHAWLMAPRQTGAVTPSSTALAEQMTADISSRTGTVIELGPGTGVFTRMLLTRGVAEENLILVESNPAFADVLRARHPRAQTLQMDAAKLLHIRVSGSDQVGAVVSGLPILSMPARTKIAILAGAFRQLSPNGAFYQFTYAGWCPVGRSILDRLDLKAQRLSIACANIPPASVYRIRRRAPRAHLGLSQVFGPGRLSLIPAMPGREA